MDISELTGCYSLCISIARWNLNSITRWSLNWNLWCLLFHQHAIARALEIKPAFSRCDTWLALHQSSGQECFDNRLDLDSARPKLNHSIHHALTCLLYLFIHFVN